MRQFCCKNNAIPVFGSGAGRSSVTPKHGHNIHYIHLCPSKRQILGETALSHYTGQANTAHNAPELPTIVFVGVGSIFVLLTINAPCRASTSLTVNRASLACRRSGCARHKSPKSGWGDLGFPGGRDPSNIFQFPP